MSFELSPEAIIFALRVRLAEIEEQIIKLQNRLQEEPIQLFKTIPVRNVQGFFSGQTEQKFIFNPNLGGIQRGNREINTQIQSLNVEKTNIEKQIPIIEFDIQTKGIKGAINSPDFSGFLDPFQSTNENQTRNIALLGLAGVLFL